MADWPQSQQLISSITRELNDLQSSLVSLDIWVQLGVIAAVFVVARWLLTPQLQRFLIRLSTLSGRVASFNHLIVTLNEFTNTLVWLFLQWIAIQSYAYLGKTHELLTPVASLLGAWLLIRIVSKLFKNHIASRVIVTVAWLLAIMSIFGWLKPALEILDSISLTIGNVRLSPLVVIKAGLGLWFSLWMASVLSTFLDRRLESSNNITPAMRVLSVKLLHVGVIAAAFLITFSAI